MMVYGLKVTQLRDKGRHDDEETRKRAISQDEIRDYLFGTNISSRDSALWTALDVDQLHAYIKSLYSNVYCIAVRKGTDSNGYS
jgi:hypothetical protein